MLQYFVFDELFPVLYNDEPFTFLGKYRYEKELHSAVRWNYKVTLRALLQREGADPNTIYGDEFHRGHKSLLHIACGKGHTECVRALLEAGARPDVHDKYGEIPLFYCLSSEFFDTATVFLTQMGDQAPNLVNSKRGRHSCSLLCSAATRCSLEGVRLLLQFGAEVNQVDIDRKTALLHLCGKRDSEEKLILLQLIDVLIKAGANVNIQDQTGDSPLHLAAGKGFSEAVKLLVKGGGNLDAVNCTRMTPLTHTMFMAEIYGLTDERMSIIRTLTKAGTDLNRHHSNVNPLLASLKHDCLRKRLLPYFLQNGADPDIVVDGDTPLLKAIRRKYKKSVGVLLKHSCNPSLTPPSNPSSRPPRRYDLRRVFAFVTNMPPSQHYWPPSLNHHQSLDREVSPQPPVTPMDAAVDSGQMDVAAMLLVAGDGSWRNNNMRRKILGAAKDTKNEVDGGTQAWFQKFLSCPPPLYSLCAYRLRSIHGRNFNSIISSFDMPERMKEDLTLSFM